MRVFVGLDPRAPVAYNVLQWSIHRRASRVVQIVPLILPQLPIKRKGLTHFTYSRYICPFLCGYQGKSVFMDSDMLMLADIGELLSLEFKEPVAVVQGPQKFEWPSLMVFNNEQCTELTPEYIDNEDNHPQTFDWAGEVGSLPSEWNHCVGYDEPRDDAKLVHFTMGIPQFPECRDSEYSEEWTHEYESMTGAVSWYELMGNSVHAKHVLSHLDTNTSAFQGV